MFPALCSINNSEGGRISFLVFQKLFVLLFFFKMSTGICQYFSLTTPFPSHEDTGIGALVAREANGSVRRVLEKQARQQSPTSQTPTELRLANMLPL